MKAVDYGRNVANDTNFYIISSKRFILFYNIRTLSGAKKFFWKLMDSIIFKKVQLVLMSSEKH